MNQKTQEVLSQKYKYHLEVLAKAKLQLIALKKETDPKLRVLKGIDLLASIKERIILTKQFLSDIKELEDTLKL